MKSERAIIVAYADNHVIGDRGVIPWMGKMPADMKRVQDLTKGNAIIMGERTFDSIGRPLPKRQNIVLSHRDLGQELDKYNENLITQKEWTDFMHAQPQTVSLLADYLSRGEIEVASGLDVAFQLVSPKKTAFIFGGASVYAQSLEQNLVDVIYATEIHGEFSGDVFFPEIDDDKWLEIDRQDFPADDENAFAYSFVKYKRRKNA